MCGDIIFSSGCGRMFSGPGKLYHASLMRIKSLSPETRLYCAHEYTLPNLKFAKHVEPTNTALEVKRQQSEKSLALGMTPKNEVDAFIQLRHMKNHF